jgi:hypothetical protein
VTRQELHRKDAKIAKAGSAQGDGVTRLRGTFPALFLRRKFGLQWAATIRQIDALVYELYGLTAEEIRIVEGA